MALGIRKVQYAPSKPGPQPCTVVRKDFVLSPGQLELELTLDKQVSRSGPLYYWLRGASCERGSDVRLVLQLYMHGETVAVNMCVRNHSTKVVKKIKASIQQGVDVVLFQSGQYRNAVASADTTSVTTPYSYCYVPRPKHYRSLLRIFIGLYGLKMQ